MRDLKALIAANEAHAMLEQKRKNMEHAVARGASIMVGPCSDGYAVQAGGMKELFPSFDAAYDRFMDLVEIQENA